MAPRKVPSKQKDNPGDQKNTLGGKVISVKLGHKTRRIGIDGSTDTIINTIKFVFGLRTKRAFWLEDIDNNVRVIDRDMHVGSYALHQDEGLMIKMCGQPRQPGQTVFASSSDSSDDSEDFEDKIFYTEDDFHDFLSRRGWTCLRQHKSSRRFVYMHELSSGGIYYGLKNW